MRNHHSQHRSKIQKIASLVLLAIALTIVTPVLAAYLGPDRTRTVQQTTCDVILRECQYIASKGDYRWHQVDSWSCSNESKPWLSYSNQSSGCDSSSKGDKTWSKKETVDDVLFTHPSATISGVLQNCTLKNGWCTTAPQLSLTGNEPVSGYRIIGLEGTLNGQGFACPGATCAVALLEGNNSFNYWALSSWTDTSVMGTLSAKVDTVKPTISGTITATSGWNGWFTSPVIFNGSASDSNPGSGLAAFTCTLDGIALASCASITINSEGPHSLAFTARDNAGQTNTFTQNASIDLQAPALNSSLAGTSGSNPAWYTSALLNGSASDTSSGSGLFALEYRLDQGSWATFPESGELTLPDGRHTVEVRATDNAGLTTSSSKAFSVDGNPPSIAIDPAGNRGANNWYVSDLSLTASASDETSGIGGLEYSLNNDSWLPYTGSLNLTDGIHEISFWATDEAGLAAQVNQTYQIDTHIPGIEGSLSGVSGENGWFTSNVTLSASALDPQPGSGIDAFTYILNGSPEESYTIPLNLSDGQHTLQLNARDNAGLSYTMEQTVNVDTLPPTLDIQTVLPHWVRETVALEGSTLDEGSGLSTLEISTNGGQTWQAVTGTTSWSHSWDTSESPSGSTEVMVRAIDKAGLIARKTLRTGVDNKAPVISLPASWFQWDTIDLDIQEEHSGLSEASLEISDPQGGGPARIITLDSATFPMQFKWDRRFADGTTAPEGKYNVKVTATDNLGNTATGNASITILLNLPPGPTATNIPTNRPPASPTISYTATAIPANTGTPTVAVKGFGSTLVPQATATPKPGTTSTPRVTPTQNKVVEWFESIIPSQLDATLKTTEISSLGVPASTTNSGSNVLWGATAAAVMGSLTAYALEERRRQQEEKIQQEEKEKQAERDRQAEKARQRALEAKDEERRDKTKDKQMAKLEVKWAQERAWEEARKAKEKEQEARYQAHMEARVLGREIAEETKRVAEEKAERERKEARKREEEENAAEKFRTAMAAYSAGREKAEEDVVVTEKKKSIWEKGLDWVDQHQAEVALGFGVAVGIGAIIFSGGIAAPLVAAAWVAGATVVAAGTVAASTIGLNLHYGREWNDNLLRNVALAGGAAAVVTGGWFLLHGAMTGVGAFCSTHKSVCAYGEPILNAIDKGEELSLNAKLAYQTWRHDEQGAYQTALELQMEYLDGNMPGNSIADDIGIDTITEVAKYGDDAVDLVRLYGVDAAKIILQYQDDGIELLQKYGPEAINLLQRYPDNAVKVLKAVDPNSAEKLLGSIDDDVLDYALEQSPEALQALAGWSAKDLRLHGSELALRAQDDAHALTNVRKLIDTGPINPEKLTDEQKALIEAIAQYSTQYADNGQVVLGKWVDYDGGFVESARDTASVHYNPHPDMWNMFGDLGEKRDEVAWLVNQQVVQTGIKKGKPFEYSLNGIAIEDIGKRSSSN